MFARWQQDGDAQAREHLVEKYLPLARKLARRYMRSSEPLDDLVQVASLALVKAIDRFDASRGSSFAAFAVPTILGELRRHFRDAAWSIHVPRGTQERALKIDEAQRVLTARSGRAPTVAELSLYLEVDDEEVLDSLQAAQAYDTLSLDAPRRSLDDEAEALGETLGVEDERFALVEDGSAVAAALRCLPRRERTILRLRFGEELTQTEIAERVGLSQMQISRILRRSLVRLRELAEGAPANAEGAPANAEAGGVAVVGATSPSA